MDRWALLAVGPPAVNCAQRVKYNNIDRLWIKKLCSILPPRSLCY